MSGRGGEGGGGRGGRSGSRGGRGRGGHNRSNSNNSRGQHLPPQTSSKRKAYGGRTVVKYHKREQEEIDALQRRLHDETPQSGATVLLTDGAPFSSLPISKLGLSGLTKAKYKVMTDIQAKAIPHALAGRDVLGAAKTGSGKSVAFIVPLLEDLYRVKWSKEDGLGAVILSPTRELASQIFSVISMVGEGYGYRLGLLLGGTNYEQERNEAVRAQVVIGTPGRILHHLEQTPGFDATFLRVLVLDEADRLLDLGFSEQLESLLSYFPRPRSDGGTRQTMMFSATQTKRVRDLATLSLQDPEFISAHAESESSTPVNLHQTYAIVELPSKFDALYSFLKSHGKHKIICFMSSCKQVRFAEAALRKLNTGMTILALHGKQKAGRRKIVHERFCKFENVVLLATDIAARGLDFPDVDWVVQVDCPEDVATYIHRVGRTARYTSKGSSVIFLLPTEADAFVKHLEASKVPITKTQVPSSGGSSNTGGGGGGGGGGAREFHLMTKLRALLAQDVELKGQAQSAFRGYLRSLHLQPDKTVFAPVTEMNVKEFAASLGLAGVPRLTFLKGASGKAGRAEVRQQKQDSDRAKTEAQVDRWLKNGEGGDDDEAAAKTKGKNKVEKLLKREPKAQKLPTGKKSKRDGDSDASSSGSDDDDDGLVVKSAAAHDATDDDTGGISRDKKPSLAGTKRSSSGAGVVPVLPYKTIKIAPSGSAKDSKSRRVEFDSDEEEDVVPPGEDAKTHVGGNGDQDEDDGGNDAFVARVAERLRMEDATDKKVQKTRLREKRREEKHKNKRVKESGGGDDDDNDGEQLVAMLGGGDDGDFDNERGMKNTSSGGGFDADEEAALKLIGARGGGRR